MRPPPLCVRRALWHQARREILSGLRPAEVEPLPQGAALRDGKAPLLLCLDALENRRGSEPPADPDCPFDYGHGPGVRGNPLGEGAVDLDEVGMDFEQAAERRVPGTEVLDTG